MLPETSYRKARSELANISMSSFARTEQIVQCRDEVPETVICER